YVPSLISTLGVSAPLRRTPRTTPTCGSSPVPTSTLPLHGALAARLRDARRALLVLLPVPAPAPTLLLLPTFRRATPLPAASPPHPLYLLHTHPNPHPPCTILPTCSPSLHAHPSAQRRHGPRVPRHPLQRRAQAPIAPLAGAGLLRVGVILERAGREAAVLPPRRPDADAVSPPQRAPPPNSRSRSC
ncbi:hypothetical protein B0H14DRAFT_2745404, partial [Mycena olivaceomarginata]